MKKVILVVLFALVAVPAFACSGSPTALDNTGLVDVTIALQSALNTAVPSGGGGGTVMLAPGRYRLDNPIHIPEGVTLCGRNEGPLEPWGVATNVVGAILQVTSLNNAQPAIQIDGMSAALTDVLVWYPQQSLSTYSVPVVYPAAIKVIKPSHIARVTVVNAYDGVDVEMGRVAIEHSYIGALHNGIYIDHAQDEVTINDVSVGAWWDVAEMVGFPSNLDAWVINNGNGIMAARVDSLRGHNIIISGKRVGMYFIDSPDTTQNPRCGYGSFADVDLDWVQYGIATVASNSPGWKFTNLDVGAAGAQGQSIGYYIAGSMTSRIVITGGSVRGVWHTAMWWNFPANTLFVAQVLQ